MRMASSVRWAVRFGGWTPTREEWQAGMRAIQPEEMLRVTHFKFQKDSKSAMVGRLMLRRAIHQQLGIPWTAIQMARSDREKPYLTNQVPGTDTFSFNVSHQGDYTVLAASTTCQVGVDVMKTEWPKAEEPVEDMFRIMRRQFTDHEWENIRAPDDEWDQLGLFHRHWCLKESYVKAVGVGLSIDLRKIDFHIKSDLSMGCSASDTKLYVNGELETEWRFEEAMLDSTHTVVTALKPLDKKQIPANSKCTPFEILTFTELLAEAQPLGHDVPQDSYDNFLSHKEAPGKPKA